MHITHGLQIVMYLSYIQSSEQGIVSYIIDFVLRYIYTVITSITVVLYLIVTHIVGVYCSHIFSSLPINVMCFHYSCI